MKRKIIATDAAPAAIGPYSQAVASEGWLFTAGQIPLDPATKELAGSDIVAQTRQVMANLSAVLAAGGAGFEDVVKSTVFLADLGHFAAFNEVYAESFQGMAAPARSTIQVAALPLGALVEIEMVARISRAE